MATTRKKPIIPNLNKTINDIKNLVYQPGYLYSLLTISLHDLFLPLEKYVDVNWWDRISYQELGYLFGLLIKKPLQIGVYPSQQDLQKHIDDTYRLLQQMHDYYSHTAFDAMMSSALKAKKETGKVPPTKERIYTAPEAIIESIFYDDSGAYDFQYWETALKRYSRDDSWMIKNFGFSIQDTVELSIYLKQLSEKKFQEAHKPINANDFNDWALSVFSFTTNDIKDFTEAKNKALSKLSVIPGQCNKTLNLISNFNELEVKPIIKLSSSSFLLPISFDLARSVDESPYYWMKEASESYFLSTATLNRGTYTEEASYELLKKVFGEGQVYINAQVHRKKGEGIKKKGKLHTDIDVLALTGNKAIIVQAKSKKLTLPSRQGNIDKLGSDFKEAVQSAYEQGLLARNQILSGNTFLTQRDGTEIKLSESINEVYILTVTTDNYPALAFQVHNFLQKDDKDPFPVTINLYDLDLLTQYLPDPYDFLFYVNQRITLAPIIFGSTEIACLGYHLTQKLHVDPNNKPDRIHIAQDFGQLIDDDVVRQRYGSEEEKKKGKIRQKWKNHNFIKLIDQIKSSGVPGLTDAIFFLYSLSSETADRLVEMMETAKKKSLQDHQSHTMAMPLDYGKGGITYVVEYDRIKNLHKHIMAYSMARKYVTKADEWLGLGSYTTSKDIIDSVVYSKDPWKIDPHLQKLADSILQPGQVISRKIGRNDPCYCGSGKKYKKCHYLIK